MRTLCGIILAAVVFCAASAVGESFTDDLDYLKRKWRADVTDKGTGLGTAGVLAGWREIVASRGDEPWETTKAKLFAFGCDRTAIGVSPHDWFPAFAPRIEGSKHIDTVALIQLAFSFATFAFFAAKTSESSRVV